MSEPTQGHWKVYEADEGEEHQFEIVGHEPAGLHPSDHVLANVFFVAYGDAGIRDGRANADLMAAAPDLLSACLAARTAIEDAIRRPMGVVPDSASEAFRLIAAAIAKAEGR